MDPKRNESKRDFLVEQTSHNSFNKYFVLTNIKWVINLKYFLSNTKGVEINILRSK